MRASTVTYLNRLPVQLYQQGRRKDPLYAARLVAKGWGHGGYSWFAVMNDGALLCAPCVRENWRQIVGDTRARADTGWCVQGYLNSGDLDEPETCAHCNRTFA